MHQLGQVGHDQVRPRVGQLLRPDAAVDPDHQAEVAGRTEALKARGVLISNFYNTKVPSFRVGCVGAITPEDMRGAVAAIGGCRSPTPTTPLS